MEHEDNGQHGEIPFPIRPRNPTRRTSGLDPEAEPASDDAQPGDVCGGGRGGRDHRAVPARYGRPHAGQLAGVHRPDRRLAVVHGAFRQLGGGHGRRPRQGPGGVAAPDPCDHTGQVPARCAPKSGRARARHGASPGRRGAGGGGRRDPRRRRCDRGCRLGRRAGDHRRVGAGHPRERRRPVGGDRRHAGAVRLDQGPDLVESGRDVSGPNDSPGRGGTAKKRPPTRSRSRSCWWV